MSTAPDTADYLRSAYPFAVIRERLRRHPGPVLDFALGSRSETPPAWLPAFLRERAELALRRYLPEELAEFANRAVETLASVYGAEVPAASILPAPSGRAAMAVLAGALIEPGDAVLVTEPGYPAFARLAAGRGARLRVAPLDPTRGFAPDLERLGEAEMPRLAGLNYPNNPTGSVLAPASLDALRGWLGPGALLFNDATYGPLTHGQPPYSLLAAAGAGPAEAPLVELHSLAKLFGLGPLGPVFLVGRPDLLDRVRRDGDFAWTQVSSLQLAVATRCLEDWGHVEQVREGCGARLAHLAEALTELGFAPFPAPAGMYLLCPAPTAVAGRAVGSATEAAEALLESYGLALAPWDVPPHRYLRFSGAYRPDELETLRALGARFELEFD